MINTYNTFLGIHFRLDGVRAKSCTNAMSQVKREVKRALKKAHFDGADIYRIGATLVEKKDV